MHSKLWRLAASAIVVTSLTACSTVSNMTGKVSQTLDQTWDKAWSSISGKKQPAAAVQTKAPAPLPSALKVSQESGRWQGLYSLQADKGRFQECESGQTIDVLPESDSVLLEQAYLNTRSNPSVFMLAEVQGRVVERPVSDPVLAQQGGKMLALRVERFVSLSSKAACSNGKLSW
ncbi:hypothetical protein KUF54_03920 [Comamonas sp. Y33R10-2]|uniref:hypothetical protein n=1 Tax=Comamonas sp. Y33R10-2 TaxID=2853257 RepID=UPI001C5C979C|nr:hypothetical protein [Comamonas sp. Y33R10-2]QXZ10401.1 hypothetical protein KUF54_03920 [Comamonas sp. Y33R10-2]